MGKATLLFPLLPRPRRTVLLSQSMQQNAPEHGSNRQRIAKPASRTPPSDSNRRERGSPVRETGKGIVVNSFRHYDQSHPHTNPLDHSPQYPTLPAHNSLLPSLSFPHHLKQQEITGALDLSQPRFWHTDPAK